MNTDRCELLLKILEKGSLAGAAEDMGYSASAVSRSLETLEAEAGFCILRRGRQGVALTKEGELLLPAIREIALAGRHYKEAVARVSGIESGDVTIGSAYPRFYPDITGIIEQFSEAYPHIRVTVVDGTSSEIAERVTAGEVDLGIISYREEYAGRERERWHHLLWDRLVIALAKSDPLAERESLTAADLKGRPYIEMYPGRESDNSRYFERNGLRPNTVFSATDTLAMYFMVKAGLGVSMTNEMLLPELPDDIAYVPLEGAEPVEVGVVFPERGTESPAARIFRRFALERLDRAWQGPAQR